jgi:hypothetical protein
MKHGVAHSWPLKLAPILLPVLFPVLLPLCGCLGSCKGGQSTDSVMSSVANPSHTWRATILLRQYMVDGHFDGSPTTYVLMDRDEAARTMTMGRISRIRNWC